MSEAGPSSPKKQKVDEEASPSASPTPVAWDLPPDITAMLVEMLVAEKDTFYDEQDLCQVAASLVCSGNPTFKEMGCEIYRRMSPRLGEDLDDLSEASTANEIKAKLKEWGLTLSGTKAEIWARLSNEVVPCHEEHCPVSWSTRKKAVALQTAYITAGRARSKYGVYTHDLTQDVPSREEQNTKPGKAPQKFYSLKHVKVLARKSYGSAESLKKSQESGRATWQKVLSRIELRKKQVRDELVKRGTSEEDAEHGMDLLWYYGYLSGDRDPEDPGVHEDVVETCVKIEEYLWLMVHTSWTSLYVDMRQNHTFTKSPARYKQLASLKERCADEAIYNLISHMADYYDMDLEDILNDDNIPESLYPRIKKLWPRVKSDGGPLMPKKTG